MNKPFWYAYPSSMSFKDWKVWDNSIKIQYPIQYFFRETVSGEISILRRRFQGLYYKIRSWFKPAHPIVRKALPRTWSDLTETMVNLNLAIIAQFKEEADDSWVNWESDEEHRSFKKWLDDAAIWVTNGRKILIQQISDVYPPFIGWDIDDGKTYEEKYGEVNRLETLLKEKDNTLIKEMIDKQDYFWT